MALQDELARAAATLPSGLPLGPLPFPPDEIELAGALELTGDEEVIRYAKLMLRYQDSERDKLDTVRRYWKGLQRLPAIVPVSAAREVRELAKVVRINVCEILVDSLAQSLFVDGFRRVRQSDNLDVWEVWGANRFAREQSGVHRSALAYGTSYVVVTPSTDESRPRLRGVSPRRMTTLYGDDPDWPVLAFERWSKDIYRLYDDTAIYTLARGTSGVTGSTDFEVLDVTEHGLGMPPVVRFRDTVDLDADDDVEEVSDRLVLGQVSPMIPLQDQMDVTTFGLMVAQHYGAFRQRYVLGWLAESEAQQMKAAASVMMTFEDHPEDIKVGEFGQTMLDGYITSRQETARFAATLSQTPTHELIGQLINLSAEALAAAEAGRDRKVDERQTGFGTSWQQVFQLVGEMIGQEVPDSAAVVWRDTSARSFAAIVDGLGKLAQTLGVPPQALWERIPGVTQQDVDRFEALATQQDAFGMLAERLAAQGQRNPAATAPRRFAEATAPVTGETPDVAATNGTA